MAVRHLDHRQTRCASAKNRCRYLFRTVQKSSDAIRVSGMPKFVSKCVVRLATNHEPLPTEFMA